MSLVSLPLNPGCCGNCNTPMWLIQNGRLTRPLPNYREFHFVTDIPDAPGSERMNRHAICAGCINSLTDQKVSAIFERIRETWRTQLVGFGTIEDFERLNAQQLICWDIDEKEAEKKYYG